MSDKMSQTTKQDIKNYAEAILKQAELLANNADKDALDKNGEKALKTSQKLRDVFNISSATDIALVEHLAKTAPAHGMPEVGEDMQQLLPFLKAMETDLSETFSKLKPGSYDGEKVMRIVHNSAATHKHMLPKK